jgi:flagellar motility protein MotE (MotC chaperone)
MSKSRARPRVLPVVILALVALAAVKATDLWVGFSSAEAAPATADNKAEQGAPLAVAPPPSASETERRMLEQLASRRAELDAREEEIATREALLEVAEGRIEGRFAALAAEETKLASLNAERHQREAEEFDVLSSAYERMKPRDAARIFEVLEEEILVPVAAGMRTQALSGVLAEMEPEKARELTRLLAERGRKEKAAAVDPE